MTKMPPGRTSAEGENRTLDLERFRKTLLERRAAIQGVVESSAEDRAPVELDQSRVGRLSRMDALQQQAMANATDERRRQELLRIESALKRIESQAFGYCAVCDEPIGERRLALDPTMATCVDCASG